MTQEENFGRGITKFNGSDYLTWKFEITQLLVAHGLDDLLDGSRPQPAGEKILPAVKAWIKENAKALSLMSSAMEKKQVLSLITCTTAKEMWDSLRNMYDHKSASSRLLLRQKFHESKMNSNESVIQYATTIQNLACQLKQAGEAISEVDIMAKILGTLSSKYNTLVTAWDSVPFENQTVGLLLERLIKEEARLSTDDEKSEALAATRGTWKKRNQYDFKSKFNGKKGPRNNDKKGQSEIQCCYCYKFGHFAREFRSKKRNTEDKITAYIATLPNTTTHDNSATTKTPTDTDIRNLLERDMRDVWMTYSDASRHITFRRE